MVRSLWIAWVVVALMLGWASLAVAQPAGSKGPAQAREIYTCDKPPDLPEGVDIWAVGPKGASNVIYPDPVLFYKNIRKDATIYIYRRNDPECRKTRPATPSKGGVMPGKEGDAPSKSESPKPKKDGEGTKGDAPKPKKDGEGTKGEAAKGEGGLTKEQAAELEARRQLAQKAREKGELPNGEVPPEGVITGEQLAKEDEANASASVLPTSRPSSGRGPMKGACGECKGGKPAEEKTAFEEFAEKMARAGALANFQTDETKSPDGKRYGIVGGKNPDGPNNPVVQAAAGAVLVTIAMLSATGTFEKTLKEVIKKNTPLLIRGTSKLAEKVAEKLAKKWGYAIADALNKNGTIGPFRLMQKFTERLGGRWHAHHILEVKWFKKFPWLGDQKLGPAVILTEAQHRVLHKKLAERAEEVSSPQALWKVYKEVYENDPHWLKAIEHYFK